MRKNNINKITSIALLISGIFSQSTFATTNPVTDVTNDDVTVDNHIWHGNYTNNEEVDHQIELSNHSEWEGNINIIQGYVSTALDDSSWQGDITFSNTDGSHAYTTLANGSTWVGNITGNGAGNSTEVMVDSGSHWQGNIQLTGQDGLYSYVQLTDQARWDGDLELSSNQGAHFSTSMENHTNWQGHATIQGVEHAASDINLQDNSHWVGNLNVSASNDNDYSYGYGYIQLYQQSTWQGDVAVQAGSQASANVLLSEASHWRGNTSVTSTDTSTDASFSANLNQGSSWNGAATVTGTEAGRLSIYAYEDAHWTGDAEISGKQVNLDGYLHDQSGWRGNATLTGDEYAYAHTYLYNESYRYGDLNVSSNKSASFYGQISAGSVWTGHLTLSGGHGDDADSYFNLYIDDHSTRTGDNTLSGHFDNIYVHLDQSEWNGGLDIQNVTIEYQPFIEVSNASTWRGYVTGPAQTMVYIEDSDWIVTGDSQIQQLDLINGSLGFGDPVSPSLGRVGSTFHTLTINGDMNYSSTAPVLMRTNLETHQGDLLIVNGDLNTDNHESLKVTLNNQGGAQIVDPERELTIVQLSGIGTVELTNDVEVGAFLYRLKHEGNEWRLYTNDRYPYTPVAQAAIETINAGYLLTFAETQTLMQRMGDLRGGQANGGAWARAFGGRFDISGTTHLPNGFDMDYAGVQVGIDRQLTLDTTGNLYLGGMFGASQSDQDYARGDGKITASHVGLYGTYVHPNGFYVDTLVKYTHMRHKDNPIDTLGQRQSAKASTDGFSGSLEIGKRFHLADQASRPATGWYVEPQLQVTVGKQSGADLHYANGLRASFDAVDSLIGRAGVLVGYELKGGDTPVNLYAKASYVREFDGDVNVRFNNVSRQESFKGEWLSSGLGVTTQLAKRHHLYADLESNNGSRFDNLQFNMGYRFAF